MERKFLNSSTLSTLYGVMALIFWGVSPAIICHAEHIPVFQLSMIMQAFSFIVTFLHTIKKKRLKRLIFELPKSAIMVPFLVSTQVCYIFAFRMAPADQVDLINYLWPMMTVVGSSFLFSERLMGARILGIFMGFSAIVLLGYRDIFSSSFNSAFVKGYILAFIAASSWTIYTLLGRSKKDVAADEHIGFHLGLSALTLGLLHLSFDQGFTPMTSQDWALAASLGILVYGLGYPMWWYGLERGKFALLTSMSYLSPILSVWVLVATGVVDWTIELCLACFMVAGGSWLVNQNKPLFKIRFAAKSSSLALEN